MWVAHHPFLVAIELYLVVVVLIQFLVFLLWTLLNSFLLLFRLPLLPFRVIWGTYAELMAGWRSIRRFSQTLAPWLDAPSILLIYRRATQLHGPLGWEILTPVRLIGRLLEIEYDCLSRVLPGHAWSELASYPLWLPVPLRWF